MKKKKNSHSQLCLFDTRRNFEFVSPYSLKVCAKRLKNLTEQNGSRWQFFDVTTDPSHFESQLIVESKSNLRVVEGYCSIVVDDTNRTQITGYARISPMAQTVLLLFCAIFLINSILFSFSMNCLSIGLVFIIGSFLQIIYMRERIISIVRRAVFEDQ